jgi:hypothetical protein
MLRYYRLLRPLNAERKPETRRCWRHWLRWTRQKLLKKHETRRRNWRHWQRWKQHLKRHWQQMRLQIGRPKF